MDNLLFVNEYSRNKDTLKENYKYWYFRRPIAVLLYAVVAFNLLLQMYYWLNEYYVEPINGLLSIFIAIAFASLYFIQVNSTMKKDKQLCHGNELKVCISVTNDRLYPGETDSDFYLDIVNVRYAFETKNYITLVMKSTRMMLILHKDGFTTGDLDGFRAFLKDKKIKIRGQKK